MDKYNFRSSKHLWAVLLTAGLLVPGIIRKSKCSRVSKRKVHFTKRSV